MNINAAGLELVKHFEGCKLEAYLCPAGVPTIGFGCTTDVRLGDTINQQMADFMLLRDLARFEKGVERLVHVDITENQFSALVSFAFNLGLGNLGNSTLLKMINAGSPEAAAVQFTRWNRANGKVLEGLTRRRIAEQKLYQGKDWK